MEQTNKIDKIFDSFVNNNLFKNKMVLQSNYTPDNIPHRDSQIESVASILAPALRGERVSNLFVYGKTGCISGESLVFTNNGWKRIKEVDADEEKVLSFNKEEKKYEWSPFLFLKFENKDKLLKIKIENGQELIVTKDHPLLLNNMSWQKANKLKIGDLITFSFNFPSISERSISYKMARLLGFTLSDGSLNRRLRRTKDSKGYFYNSDRQRYRYFSVDNDLLSLVQSDLKDLFTCTPSIEFPKNRCSHVQVISQQICQELNKMGVPFGDKSSIIVVPDIILQANQGVQVEFLKALFSGDGTVSTQTYMVEYYSNSLKFLKQLSLLLHQQGIACKIRYKKAKLRKVYFDAYRLYISGKENLERFYHKIGFYSQVKQKKLGVLLGKYKRKGLYSSGDFLFYKVNSIEEVYEDFVYDLTVPKNHNFIANGIISHNTGKTLSVQKVVNRINEKMKELGNGNLKVLYVNCKLKKVADTEYRIIAELIKQLKGSVPATGLPTDFVYSKFVDMIDDKKQNLLIVLDEIDQAVKKISDNFIYTLTRMNTELKNAQISIIGISNSLTFMDNLDPRVRSSLGEEELVFSPYDALQLQDILKERAEQAFKEGTLGEGVITKCAALAAREHGDARRALDLLRVAGELAERENSTKIKEEHIDQANQKIEKDKMLDIIEGEPKQFQLVLQAIINLSEGKSESIFTGDVFNEYEEICKKTKNEVLTQRRVSDIIAEFDMLGLINARVISKGRQGRTREIKLMLASIVREKAKTILQDAIGL